MNDESGIADFVLLQVIFEILLKSRTVTPANLREILDGAALSLEKITVPAGQESRLSDARKRLGLLVGILETTNPAMRLRSDLP